MVPTEALRRELRGAGFERLAVVARGVDTRQFDPARRSEALRARWGVDADTLVVCCVGRLAPREEPGRAAARLRGHARASSRRPRLVLVGDGPAARRAASARCPDAIFAGQRTRRRSRRALRLGRPLPVPQPDRDLRQRDDRGHGQRPAVVAFDYAAAAQLIAADEQGVLRAVRRQRGLRARRRRPGAGRAAPLQARPGAPERVPANSTGSRSCSASRACFDGAIRQGARCRAERRSPPDLRTRGLNRGARPGQLRQRRGRGASAAASPRR